MDNGIIDRLLKEAAKARGYARVGRTGFHVGAALLTSSGEIVSGCNLELNSTLVSICAERCAISKAVSMGYCDFTAIAVVSDAHNPVAPCGICRQFLVDFNIGMSVIMADSTLSEIKLMTAGELAPMAFVSGCRESSG